MPWASGRFSLQLGDDVEAVAVPEPHVDHGEGRRAVVEEGQPVGDRFGGRDREAARLHRPRQALQERLVVVDDEQGPVVRQPVRRPTSPGARRPSCDPSLLGSMACRTLQDIDPGRAEVALRQRVASGRRRQAAQSARARSRRAASRSARWRRVPAARRLAMVSMAPERSSSVLAMKKPRPRPDSSPAAALRAVRDAGGDVGLAELAEQIRREARPVVDDRHHHVARRPADRRSPPRARQSRRRSRRGCRGRRAGRDCAAAPARLDRSAGRSMRIVDAEQRGAARPPPRAAARSACGRTAPRPCPARSACCRMSRQRLLCSRSSRMSSACGPPGGSSRSSSLATSGDGGERRAELVRRRRGEAVERGEVLLARQHQLGGGERVGELARLLGDLPAHRRRRTTCASRIASHTPA